jgi:hypothetical protein
MRDRVGIEFAGNAEAIEHCKKLARRIRGGSLRDDKELEIAGVNSLGCEIHLESVTGSKAASVGGLYPPFTVAPLAPCRIDFAARLRGLLYRPEAGALAYRAFVLIQLRGHLWHVIPSFRDTV